MKKLQSFLLFAFTDCFAVNVNIEWFFEILNAFGFEEFSS